MNLDQALVVLASVTALAAAARSTWSPCGLSMLSSLTPFGERSRGHRYAVTAAWFIAGATAGGASLGAVGYIAALLAEEVGVGRHRVFVASTAASLALLSAAVDAECFGPVLPVVRRQVNDRWLSRYRSWVYAAGFGWQIGSGIATYVMTASVFVFLLFSAASASPLASLAVATGFGAVRGAAVLLTGRATDPAALRALHRKLELAREPVRWTVILVLVASGVVLCTYATPLLVPAYVAVAASGLFLRPRPRSAPVATK